ncbi:MAG TPA: sigma-70 family RNA polymerase sigma factor [Bryobacteraceae bacterium]|jgi:RNA polymerase sigma-70 factor (ECF subfamily)|nr:sigma-70 family RNA polymerase sigma factor [Bryobacteraceae bacterium]
MPFGPADCDSEQWVRLVTRITNGDGSATEELYLVLSAMVRGRLSCTVGPELIGDAIHEVMVIVLEAIHNDALREPSRLMGFVKIVAQRRAVAHIRAAVLQRRRQASIHAPEPRAPRRDSPDNHVDQQDRRLRADQLLQRLTARDREILVRFYLREQPRAQICVEMHLTETQFRLFKSRAIAHCSSFSQFRAA